MPRKPLAELKAQIGDSYHVIEDFEIEAGKVEEFARALGEDDPLYRDDEEAKRCGFDSVPAPLTFSRTSSFPRYRPDMVHPEADQSPERPDPAFRPGIRWENFVHGEHEFEFGRPLNVGDVLTGDVTLVDVASARDSEVGR